MGPIGRWQNGMKQLWNTKMLRRCTLFLKVMVSVLAVQGGILSLLEWGYKVDIPVVKWIFSIFQNMDGWGIETVFVMAGVACIFYIVRDHSLQRNWVLSALSVFFAVCTLLGQSFYDLGGWYYVFHGRLQFGLACFVTAGYYWLYKNTIILCKSAYDRWNLGRRQPKGKIEEFLFVKHPFAAPFGMIAICCLPIMICFFPGTLQADAHKQLWIFLGVFKPWTNNNPAGITWMMGECLYLSRLLFGTDSMALFFFAGPQYVSQWLVFAYTAYVLNRMEVPVFLRKAAIVYFAACPLWQIWGFTVVKDTYHYIALLLLVVLCIHVVIDGRTRWYQLLAAAWGGIFLTQSRNDGIYLLLLYCFLLLFLYRKCWKLCAVMISCAVFSLAVVNLVYIPKKGITSGPIGESLSIPLLQTARYLVEHPDDVTDEERTVLEKVFSIPPEELGYPAENSDAVKNYFVPDSANSDFWEYICDVWWPQFCRHPETYVQAFLNHVYGYFYPNRYSLQEIIGTYHIMNADHWQDGYLDMETAIKNREVRDFFEQEARYFTRLPLFGMLYSCGIQNYILLGCIAYLLAKKRSGGIVMLLPSVFVVIGCMFSPINASVRYMLPVMAIMPLAVGWCCYLGQRENETVEQKNG